MMASSKDDRPSKLIPVLGVIFLIIGLIFLIGTQGAYWTDTQIETHGLSTQGHLEKKVFLAASDGDSDYILEYWFTTKNGVRIDASRHVSKALWEAVQVHQMLDIQYSPTHPQRNFPKGEGVTSLGLLILTSLFGVVFACLGLGLIWSYFRQ